MPRKNKVIKSNRPEPKRESARRYSLSSISLSESYISLLLGAFVVVVVAIVLFFVINGKRIENQKVNNNTREQLQQQLDEQVNKDQGVIKENLNPSANPNMHGKSYKVVEGDNLWNIAVSVYGDGYRWPEIAKLSNLQNPDLIYPDQVLNLP